MPRFKVARKILYDFHFGFLGDFTHRAELVKINQDNQAENVKKGI